MKILMFGRGVIASIYGWAFQNAGHEVEFYVRPGRAQQYGSSVSMTLYDMRYKLLGTRIEQTWQSRLRETLSAHHNFDLIILSVPQYSFSEASGFFASRIGKATVLVFNNFWEEPQAASSAMPADQLVWGFPMVGGGFDSQGHLRGSMFGKVYFGTFGGAPTDRQLAVQDLFRQCGFGFVQESDFRGWLFIHFAQNAAFHSELLRIGSAKAFTGSTRSIRESFLTLRELLPLLRARGVDFKLHSGDMAPFRIPASKRAPAI
jgi:2-dehydropantoate 2-reductase